ncbi:MAG: cleavage and polyadenylation specificity factor subunit 1-like [Trebouxia sp. A1-2]|nr:MAG: cleavage and polyadenylation specificity factor subunit 1-like [Trebouxia sp. A1-2]
MALYYERHPPTGATLCSSSYFTHVPRQARDSTKSLPDLIIVRSNLLQIYKVRVPYDKTDAASLAGSKLEQIVSFPLAGLVESMAVLRGRSSSQKDALLLTFRDAKLSVLDWDDNAHTIHTSSLHYFEGDPSLRMGRTVFPMGPKVVTDPQGRCAAVLMFHTQLALLPAMETEGLELDLMMDDPYGEGVEGPGGASTELVSATVGNSYVVNLAKMGVKKVRDIVFLHKYNEPVLLILHEVHPTWPARYRDAKDTMALAALSVNVVHKRHPRIWEASGLPSDTFRLIPVPTGGALALSQNMIMYHTQGASSGLVVNSHAMPGKVPEKLEIDVEGVVLPAQLAAEHAAKYPDNVHPDDVGLVCSKAFDAQQTDVFCDAQQAEFVLECQYAL